MYVALMFSVLGLAAATDKTYAKIERRLSSIARANNVSHTELLVQDLRSFVSDDGVRRQSGRAPKRALRLNKEEEEKERSLRRLKVKLLDLMRQAVYGAQGRLQDLEPILRKYKGDEALRMSFLMKRLDQLIVDMRRIFTMSYKSQKRVWEQMVWYAHCTRKYLDVLYTVQYAVELHIAFMAQYGAEIRAYGDQH